MLSHHGAVVQMYVRLDQRLTHDSYQIVKRLYLLGNHVYSHT